MRHWNPEAWPLLILGLVLLGVGIPLFLIGFEKAKHQYRHGAFWGGREEPSTLERYYGAEFICLILFLVLLFVGRIDIALAAFASLYFKLLMRYGPKVAFGPTMIPEEYRAIRPFLIGFCIGPPVFVLILFMHLHFPGAH
jgi:hypothetical protein